MYLAAIATGTALAGGDLDPPAQVLDENSVALSEVIASVYGDDAGERFLALWRKHIEFFVDYTTASAAGDAAGKAQAAADLDGYPEDFGAFLSSANPNLPKEAVAEDLKPHVATLFAVIDAIGPHAETGGYINFMAADFMAADDDDRVPANYGESYEHLVDVKREYDPDNLRVNESIEH